MVKQAIRQIYTYYDPSYPEGKVVEGAAPSRRGKAWTPGSYRHPVYPSPLEVRVGDAGLKVWMVIQLLRACNNDAEELVRRHRETVGHDDIQVAAWFYQNNREAIDRKLEEERVEA